MDNIDPEQINKLFLDCLFRDEEVTEGTMPENAVLIDGVLGKFGLHRERLLSHRAFVNECLKLLPNEFREIGGWSFLNACVQQDGEQWTGLHQRMDQLIVLGIGLGLAKWTFPRDLWSALPAGMPYFQVMPE
jgi:hypothetical protein